MNVHDVDLKFKRFYGGVINDLDSYVNGYLDANPDCDIFIGTDSQSKKDKTTYVTVVCFWTRGRGAHVIYTKNKLPRGKDIYTYLWNEVEFTARVAQSIKEILADRYDASKYWVDLDLNPHENHKSNFLYNAGVGYMKGIGFNNVRTKPSAWAASYAADKLCRL